MLKDAFKLLVPCVVLTLGSATAVFADDTNSNDTNMNMNGNANMNNNDNNCCPQPCPPKPCCVPTCCPPIMESCCSVCPPCNEVTPKAGPCLACGSDVVITADFIYWAVREEGLEYALTPTNPSSVAGTPPGKGKVYHPDTKWNPGFKVGLGTDLGHDGWDLYAQYTWYQARHDHHGGFSGSDDISETPVFSSNVIEDAYWFVNTPGNPLALPSYAEASERWRLNFNVLDLEMGRNMYLSPRLMFRPFFGLKGAWQNQHLNVGFETAPVAGTFMTFAMSNKMKIWGIGIRAGFDTAWHFSREFSLVGNLAFTGLWEEFKTHREDNNVTVTPTATSTPIILVNVSENCTTIKPVIEWMLGLRYEFWTCGDDYHFAFEADWEAQSWVGQNHFIRLPGQATAEGKDLGLQGLTFQVRFDF